MRKLVKYLVVTSASLLPLVAQTSPSKSPTEVLKAFRQMDSRGDRLTESGWYRAAENFYKPAPPPKHKALAVFCTEQVKDGPSWEGKNRVVIFDNYYAVGQIDDFGKFTFMVAPELLDVEGKLTNNPKGQIYGPHSLRLRPYYLVLTDRHWVFDRTRKALVEVNGPPEWRLEYFQFEPLVTIDTAIRYLTNVMNTSTSDRVRGNASNSISTLRGAKCESAQHAGSK